MPITVGVEDLVRGRPQPAPIVVEELAQGDPDCSSWEKSPSAFPWKKLVLLGIALISGLAWRVPWIGAYIKGLSLQPHHAEQLRDGVGLAPRAPRRASPQPPSWRSALDIRLPGCRGATLARAAGGELVVALGERGRFPLSWYSAEGSIQFEYDPQFQQLLPLNAAARKVLDAHNGCPSIRRQG